jgi:hypothetical protein
VPSRYYYVSDPNPIRRIWTKLLMGLGRWQPPDQTREVTFSHPSLELPLTPLDRVIAIGQTVETAGINVELLAIEVRTAGALLYWRARPVRELMLLSADVVASDDQGTTYRSLPAGHEGSAIHWSGQSVLIPPPPRNARLTIDLLSFGPPQDRPVPRDLAGPPVVGPWRFTVTA